MSPEEIYRRVKHEQRRLENKLDRKLGFYYWRTYWATSLWANLATPLNLGITIFTALMTAHSSSGSSFISDSVNMQINIATFFISIINTFFTPQKQFTDLNEYLSQWSDLGNSFEQIVFSDSEPAVKINEYTEILNKANTVHKEQFSKHRNFVTDLLHVLVRTLFMNSNDRWMSDGSFEFYEKIQEAGIELEFDYKEFKYSYKKANLLERLCYCFSCCFKHESSPEVSKHDPRIYDTITVDDFERPVESHQVELVTQTKPIESLRSPEPKSVSRTMSQEESYDNPIYDINIIGSVPLATDSNNSVRSQSLTI